MIPETLIDTGLTIVDEIETTKTYKVSADKIQGFTDDLEALEQAVYKVLNTEMYEYPIYSFDYGIELENLIGQDPIYVRIEIKRRIEECLLQDERIESIDNFEIKTKGDEMICSFDVKSIYGTTNIIQEVNI